MTAPSRHSAHRSPHGEGEIRPTPANTFCNTRDNAPNPDSSHVVRSLKPPYVRQTGGYNGRLSKAAHFSAVRDDYVSPPACRCTSAYSGWDVADLRPLAWRRRFATPGERDEEVSMNWSASRLTAFQALAA